jgi:hypothetical protein
VIKEVLTGLLNPCRPVIFSLFWLFDSCTEPKENTSERISIIWKDGRATGLSIADSRLREIPNDSLRVLLKVRMAGSNAETPITGDYVFQQNEIVFTPLIPFTRGMRYPVFFRNDMLGEVEIERSTEIPELIAIYPSRDTIPENLLKIYLVFNRPMVEGRSLQYVSLVNHEGKISQNTFLDLHPELWNAEGTILTLGSIRGGSKGTYNLTKSWDPH